MDNEPEESSTGRKRKICCDPFKCHSTLKLRDLKRISEETMTSYPSLRFQSDDQLCTSCRKEVAALPVEDKEMTSAIPSSSSESLEPEQMPGTSACASMNPDVYEVPEEQLEVINESLQVLGESPLIKRKVHTRVKYVKEKAKAIHNTVKKKLELISGVPLSESDDEQQKQDSEMIHQLKEKFRSCTNRSEKVQGLTVLPKSWSNKKIELEFGATNYIVRRAKKN